MRFRWLALLAAVILVVAGCAQSDGGGDSAQEAKGPITIGSKIDTEGSLLGNMIKAMLEANGFETVDKISTGQTDVVRKALTAGEIDVYPEYTATAYSNFFSEDKLDPETAFDAEESYKTVKDLDAQKNNLTWLGKAPANNTWAVAIQKDVADSNSIATWEDFAKYVNGGGDAKIVGSAEFFDRDDAFKNFEKIYGFTLKEDQRIVVSGGDTAQTAKAASQGTSGANGGMVYGTDAGLDALGLVVLKDTEGAQPVYQPAPVFRTEITEKYPEIAGILDPVFASLDEATLQNLNGKIALEGMSASEVATTYLTEKGFLK